jgi:hypothetical protein
MSSDAASGFKDHPPQAPQNFFPKDDMQPVRSRACLLLQKCADELRFVLDAESCSVGKIVGQGEHMYIKILAESPHSPASVYPSRYEIDLGLLRLLFLGQKRTQHLDLVHPDCVTVHDVEALLKDSFASQFYQGGLPSRAYISAPLVYENELQGVVVCSNSSPRYWDETDREIIVEIGEDIAVVLELAEAYGENLEQISSIYSKRRLDALQLRELKSEHLKIINCFKKGMSYKEIAHSTGIGYRKVRHRVMELLTYFNTSDISTLSMLLHASKSDLLSIDDET